MKTLGGIIVTLVMHKLQGNPSEALIMAVKSTVFFTRGIESLLEGREKQVQLKSEFEDIATSVQRR